MHRHGRARIVMLISVFSLLWLSFGCQTIDTSPGAGRGDPYPAPVNDPQISVLNAELRPWLGFQPAVVIDQHNPNRKMRVEVPVRNLAERQYLIEYRILFYNENGVELEPVMGWKMVPLDPKQNQRLKGQAMHNEAVDYRLEVRWAR